MTLHVGNTINSIRTIARHKPTLDESANYCWGRLLKRSKPLKNGLSSATDRQSELDAAIRAGQTTLREIETQIEQIERQIVLHKERQLNIQKQRERALQTLGVSQIAQQTALLTQKRGADTGIPET